MKNSREYEYTHGHIKFLLNMIEASYKMWLLLGAAESKCKHLAGIPLRPEKYQELNQISLKKGVRATTAIEGNTLSEADVDKIYSGKDSEIPLSRKYQAQEIKNVLEVYNQIIDSIKAVGSCEISLEILKSDNAAILKDIELEDGVIAGEIRTYPVVVGYDKGAPAEDCEYLLERLFEWLNSDWKFGEYRLVEGILKAIIAHLYIAWIHPFGDGNGRTARVLEFRMLMKAGVPLTAAHLLTSYYNDTREQYYERLRDSSRVENGELDFVRYALQGFVDALDNQIKSILLEQLDITWENYIYEFCFSGKLTPALKRRRELLIEISKFDSVISLDEMRYRLSSEILKQYQGSVKMFQRDLNYLESQGLLYVNKDGYFAAKDKMLSFLPLSTSVNK